MRLYIFLFIILFSLKGFSQSDVFYSKRDTLNIKSSVFGTLRKVVVSFPSTMDNDMINKNCIIYLDGNSKAITNIISQSSEYLYYSEDMPLSILVGIIHEERDIELTEKSKLFYHLNSEVLPILSEKYKIDNPVTIIGHSFGGYFATYCFLKNNTVFNSCIAISPAYWVNDKDIFEVATQYANQNLTGNLFLAIGDTRWIEISIRDFVFDFESLINLKTSSINSILSDLKGFTHTSTPVVGIGLGLNFCFSKYSWNNTLIEQNEKIKQYPNAWQFYEIKADALLHLNRYDEAVQTYNTAIEKLQKDKSQSDEEKKDIQERIKSKIETKRKE